MTIDWPVSFHPVVRRLIGGHHEIGPVGRPAGGLQWPANLPGISGQCWWTAEPTPSLG